MTPADLSLSEAGRRLRDGALTALALTEAHLDRIAAADPVLHAFTEVLAETARDEAARADAELAAGRDRGPLHGLPIGIKDGVDVAGTVTACGSAALAGAVAGADAEVVRRLRAAGAVIIGKLTSYELGLVGPSFDALSVPAVNPWDPERVTGGSSSGCAAAVAAGLLRTSIGSDTGGSIRGPAAYCGVVGLKPTYGLAPSAGVAAAAPSLDHVGPLAATVAEAALTLDAIAAPGHTPAASRLHDGVWGLRIAYARDWFAADPALDPGVLEALDAAASTLSLLGARIIRVALPDPGLMEAVGAVIIHAETLATHRETLRARGDVLGRQPYQSLAAGVCLGQAELDAARRAAGALRAEVDAVLAGCDALITASVLTPAPPVAPFRAGRAAWTPMRTLPFNVTGHPALVLPAGFVRGMPIGMQIVGPAFAEATICRIGHAFELATDHAVQRPPARPRDAGMARGAQTSGQVM